MQNLLPFDEKKKLLKEYRIRLVVVITGVIGALVLASLILLIPAYFLTSAKNDFISELLTKLQHSQISEDQEKEIVTQTQSVNKMSKLFLDNASADRSVVSVSFMQIVDSVVPWVNITGLSYEFSTEREKFIVKGNARDRESLAMYLEALKKQSNFTSVDMPISSYVKSTNIEFSIALTRDIKIISKN